VNTFEEMLAEIGDYENVGLTALHKWGYSRAEAGQEVLVKLWEWACEGRRPDFIHGYMVTSLRRAEISKVRKAANRLAHYQYEDYPTEDRTDDFLNLIQDLSDDRQELLFMSYYMGYKNKELAEMYGVELGTIKSRLSRSCKILRN